MHSQTGIRHGLVLACILLYLSSFAIPPAQAGQEDITALFEQRYNAWLKVLIASGSNPSVDTLMQSQEFKAIVDMGVPALPLIMDKSRGGSANREAMYSAAGRIIKCKLQEGNSILRWWNYDRLLIPLRLEKIYREAEAAKKSGDKERHASLIGRIEDMGTPALPQIIDRIKAGDRGLVPVMSRLTSGAIAPEITAEQAVSWWEKNVGKWTIPAALSTDDSTDMVLTKREGFTARFRITPITSEQQKLKALFEERYSAWAEYINQPKVSVSSRAQARWDCDEFRAIVALGVPALPLIIKRSERTDHTGHDFFLGEAACIIIDRFTGQNDINVIDWWREGRHRLPNEFKERYDDLQLARGKGDSLMCSRIYRAIGDLGVLVLPYIIERIEAGDSGLIPIVSRLADGAVPPDCTAEEILAWWKSNADKWSLPPDKLDACAKE